MKNLTWTIAALACILYLASCSKGDGTTGKSCGSSSNRVAVFEINNADSFLFYETPRHFGDITKVTAYSSSGGRSVLYLNMGIGNVCPYEDALISGGFNTIIHDPSLLDTLAFREQSLSTLSKRSVPFDPNITSYGADEPLTFTGQTDPTGISSLNAIYFPAQGSWNADSLYFFTNFLHISLSVTYNTK